MPRLTLTVPGKAAQPYRFSLDRQIVHFGRGGDNDIILESPSVSAEHAVMERIIGGYVLTDLGSTNGVKLNGEKVSKVHLRNGQAIQLGDIDFQFTLSEEEMTALRLEDPTSQLPPMDEPPTELPPSTPTSPEIELKAEAKPMPSPEPREEAASAASRRDSAGRPSGQAASTSGRSGSGFNMLVAVLAVVAFLIGVAMHYKRATGDSLIEALQYKLGGDGAGAASGEDG